MAAILPFLPTIIGAVGSIGSSMLSRRKDKKIKESPIQTKQRELIDQILASVKGSGPFSDMFNVDENAFQKSYVDPAKSMFQNQIVPSIQQGFIGGQGDARASSTGLEDQLTRAGVDLDQILNQQYSSMQDAAQQRKTQALQAILGQNAGVAPVTNQSYGSAAKEGLAGYLSTSNFPDSMQGILDYFQNRKPRETNTQDNSLTDTFIPKRKGFETDPMVYNWRTGVQQ
jgi:hypothetical protein